MRPSEIANRLTGFSTPFLGIQWTRAVLDREIAREVVVFLEDRRVLYSPYEAEVPDYVLRSVFEIRSFLTEILRRGQMADELRDPLRAMRVACRSFIEQAGVDDEPQLILPSPQDILGGGTISWIFNQQLGKFRGVFGIHLALIAVRYDIEVPDELATILPLEPAGRERDMPF